jgi:RNA polymerase sigma-70 factor (ECF subfamily)
MHAAAPWGGTAPALRGGAISSLPDPASSPTRPDVFDAGRVGPSAMLMTRSVAVAGASEDDPDDQALLAAVARGDARAYRKLADRHLAPILRYGTRLLGDAHEAEDVAQETFLRLWQHAASYEPRGSKASTWLYRIAHNLCVDRLRRRRDHADADAVELAASGDRASGELAHKELAEQLEAALAQLPERQRAAVVLVHHEGLSQNEAAQVLECGPEAVESLLARGRRGLRKLLARTGDREGGEPG